jgi:hypothetical protein
MPSLVNLLKFLAALALVFGAGGCTTVAAPEKLLHQAGFRPFVVRNDAQLAQVQALPQGRISIVERNNRSYYMFPSVARDQVFVGRRSEYDAYVRFMIQQRAANEQVASAPLDASAVVWVGGWKTWGPFFPLGEPLEY